MPVEDFPITPLVPRTARRVPLNPSDEQSNHVYVTDNRVLTEHEVQAMKYRRQRDLNNLASKRSRENRKRKQNELEEELMEQQRRNLELKSRLESLAAEVQRVKETQKGLIF